MIKVFLVHGFRGAPNSGWKPWLMAELNKSDIYACALPMPDPYEPKKEAWMDTIRQAIKEPNEEIFLVGHSLGVPAIFGYLQSLPADTKIGGAVLVSGPYKKIKPEDLESKIRKMDNFYEPELDFQKIKSSCDRFMVIHGDDDEKVPIAHGEHISKELGCELTIIPNGGHLNCSAGWRELPQVLEAILEITNPLLPRRG